jgi:hypothetical protein
MSDPDAKADARTDASKLVTTDTVFVSPDGGVTDEAFPKPGVEYDFCVDVVNAGELSSGPFFVRFDLSGDQDPPMDIDFAQDDGLDAGAAVKAVVHFGKFPNTFATYHLTACIYSSSAPEQTINCAGTFDITVNTNSDSASPPADSGDGADSATPDSAGTAAGQATSPSDDGSRSGPSAGNVRRMSQGSLRGLLPRCRCGALCRPGRAEQDSGLDLHR